VVDNRVEAKETSKTFAKAVDYSVTSRILITANSKDEFLFKQQVT
jgi:hypothetical protein